MQAPRTQNKGFLGLGSLVCSQGVFSSTVFVNTIYYAPRLSTAQEADKLGPQKTRALLQLAPSPILKLPGESHGVPGLILGRLTKTVLFSCMVRKSLA